jgi:translocation and assembly module TamA
MLHYFSRLSQSRSRSARLLTLALLLAATACGSSLLPGERYVRKLLLSGVKNVEDDKLRDGLGTQEISFWGRKKPFRPGVLDTDIKRIAVFYAANGFFDARVKKRVVTPVEQGKAVDVRLEVDEGAPTNVTAIRLFGPPCPASNTKSRARPTFKSNACRELEEQVAIAVGSRFNHAQYLGAKARIKTFLRQHGYAYADVGGKVFVHRKKRQAELRFTIKRGPKVRFGKASFKGYGKIDPERLQRRVTFQPGEPYDEREMSRTRARLEALRVFSSVRLELPEKAVEQAPIAITVRPGKLHELRLGFGVGIERQRHEVRLRTGWTIHDFLGGLRQLDLSLRPAYVVMPAVWEIDRSGPTIISDAKLTQPDLFGTPLRGYLRLGYDIETQLAFRSHGPRIGLGVEWLLWRDRVTLGLGWNMRFLDFFDIKAAVGASETILGLEFVDPYRLAYFNANAALDLRDDALDPRVGVYLGVSGEFGLRVSINNTPVLGDFDYLLMRAEVRGYLPLGTKRLVLAMRGMVGQIELLGKSRSPVTQRFRLGGPTSHRGFTSGQLSPQGVDSNGDRVPLGGNAAVLLSADLRWRMFKLFGFWLGLGPFIDYGDSRESFDAIDFGDMHAAVGGSLKYKTPFGLIRIDVAVRLNRVSDTSKSTTEPDNPDPGERLAFSITLGEAF